VPKKNENNRSTWVQPAGTIKQKQQSTHPTKWCHLKQATGQKILDPDDQKSQDQQSTFAIEKQS